jgi:hypothetical protein
VAGSTTKDSGNGTTVIDYEAATKSKRARVITMEGHEVVGPGYSRLKSVVGQGTVAERLVTKNAMPGTRGADTGGARLCKATS